MANIDTGVSSHRSNGYQRPQKSILRMVLEGLWSVMPSAKDIFPPPKPRPKYGRWVKLWGESVKTGEKGYFWYWWTEY